MGRRNKTYSKDLHQQAYDQLTGMLAFGESKKRQWPPARRRIKYFLTPPIKIIGSTSNIFGIH